MEYRLGFSTVLVIFEEVCKALPKALREHIKPPRSNADWDKLHDEFYTMGFPQLCWGH